MGASDSGWIVEETRGSDGFHYSRDEEEEKANRRVRLQMEERLVLAKLSRQGRKWVRPLDVGGNIDNHVAHTLARLVKKGKVRRRLRRPRKKYQYNPAYLYKLV